MLRANYLCSNVNNNGAEIKPGETPVGNNLNPDIAPLLIVWHKKIRVNYNPIVYKLPE